MSKLISRYTNAIIDFAFKEGTPPAPLAESTDSPDDFAKRIASIAEKSRSEKVVLFGLGSGDHALALARQLPETEILACETDLDRVRLFLKDNPQWTDESSKHIVVADISIWAQLYLLALSGVTPDNATLALNPAMEDAERDQYKAFQKIFRSAKPHQAINSSYLSHVGVQAPDLSVGVILAPDEPGLDEFFGQFPDWIKEVVVIWDAEEVPESDFRCAPPLTQIAHPLKDFADQRNRMLDACTAEWVLSLDGDEMFSEDVWGLFTACMLIKRLEACYFPRMTFYPDETRVKAGYGLWPDLQLRLFRNKESVRYKNPVHERVTGIEGRVALALDAPILHYSRLRKTTEELAAKLRRFDEAGQRLSHILNEDYPTIERNLLAEASFIMGALQMLLLEENPA